VAHSSETSVLISPIKHHIPEDGIILVHTVDARLITVLYFTLHVNVIGLNMNNGKPINIILMKIIITGQSFKLARFRRVSRRYCLLISSGDSTRYVNLGNAIQILNFISDGDIVTNFTAISSVIRAKCQNYSSI
jgi:hypothetical protein